MYTPRYTRHEGILDDQRDVLVDIVDSHIQLIAVWHQVDRGIARQGEVEGQIGDGCVLDANVGKSVDLFLIGLPDLQN